MGQVPRVAVGHTYAKYELDTSTEKYAKYEFISDSGESALDRQMILVFEKLTSQQRKVLIRLATAIQDQLAGEPGITEMGDSFLANRGLKP